MMGVSCPWCALRSPLCVLNAPRCGTHAQVGQKRAPDQAGVVGPRWRLGVAKEFVSVSILLGLCEFLPH